MFPSHDNGSEVVINAFQFDFSSVQTSQYPIVRISLNGFPELRKFVSTGRLGCILSVEGTYASICLKIDESAIKGDYLELVFNTQSAVSSFTFYLIFECEASSQSSTDVLTVSYVTGSGGYWYGFYEKFIDLLKNLPVTAVMSSHEWTKPASGNCPFYSSTVDGLPAIPLSALPFRAYESYYNALVS